ncbi:MAG: ABC transporter ATP-binding protein [Candidatus Eremiobacteraeota bacterium]|nr:ABC transporter ATP-binding protein [Candidatus Eremiobacteraeota bacterium]
MRRIIGKIKKNPSLITLRRVIKYSFPYWKPIVLSFVCTFIVNGLALLQPLMIKYLIDNIIDKGNPIRHIVIPVINYHFSASAMWIFNAIVISFIVLVVTKGIFAYAQGYLMPYGVQQAIRDIRDDVFLHIQFLPLRTIEKFKTGDLIVRVLNDSGSLATALGVEMLNFANYFIIIMGALGWMFWKDWKMTLLILAVSPLVTFAVIKFGRYINQAAKRGMIQSANITSRLQECITGIRITKGFAREDYEIGRFKNENNNLFGITMKMAQFSATQAPVVEFLAALGITVAVWYGGMEVIRGRFSVGDMFAFWGFMVMAMNPINKIASTYASLQSALVSANRIFEIMDSPLEEEDSAGAIDPGRIKGHLKFQNVWFEYDPGVPVLKDITFEVRPGTILALVGKSGAGKSTTVSLVPRFYDPVKGEIILDGYNLKNIRLKSLRSQLGIVSQETVLFSGTIRENLLYGKLDATQEEVEAAAKAAHAHDFIMQMPQGYDTRIGERGMTLSGGQRQRLAIARALLRDPRILILDEATSSVDTQSEVLIQEALDRLMKGRTTIVIAHRLSTVRKAHKIVVLEDGRIEEMGTHEELFAQGGLYAEYCKTQLRQTQSLVKAEILNM